MTSGVSKITCTADKLETIPVKLSYKDADGNVYDTIQDVKISASGITSQSASTGPPVVPIAAGIAILLIFIGGWAYYLRTKKQ